MQFKVQNNSLENKPFCSFSEDGTTLITMRQDGTYSEVEIQKGEKKPRASTMIL
jgi:hypothetical protein